MKIGRSTRRSTFITAMLVVGAVLSGLIWLVFFKPDEPTPDLSSEDVALGYLTALADQDYLAAPDVLSPAIADLTRSEAAFLSDLERAGDLPITAMQPCYYVEEVTREEGEASIKLREQYYDPCTGIEVHNLSYDWIWVKLRLESEGWRITGPSKYYSSDWNGEAKE
jgi:hypothetical protein